MPRIHSDCISSLQRRQLKVNPTGDISSCRHHSSVQSLISVQHFATPWIAAHQASLSITYSRTLLKLMSIEFFMPSNHLILCRPLLLLPSDFPSIRVFSNKSVLRVRWPKYWSFNYNISPSNEYSGLISLLTKGLSRVFSNSTVQKQQLRCSAFFTVQFLYPYMTPGKTIDLTRQTFVGNVSAF